MRGGGDVGAGRGALGMGSVGLVFGGGRGWEGRFRLRGMRWARVSWGTVVATGFGGVVKWGSGGGEE